MLPGASTIWPSWLEIAISVVPRSRAWRFSSASPVSPNASIYASNIGSIGTVRKCSPVRRASSAASLFECSEEYFDGIDTPYTCSAPSASQAMAATSAESMPPDRPISTERKPFFSTYARSPTTSAE